MFVSVHFAAGIESAAKVYRTESSARIFGTRRRDGAARLPVRRLELVAAFLVQVCNCAAGLSVNADGNFRLTTALMLQYLTATGTHLGCCSQLLM